MPASGSNLDAAEREFKAAELSLKSAETRLKSLGKPSGTGSPRIYVKLEDEEVPPGRENHRPCSH